MGHMPTIEQPGGATAVVTTRAVNTSAPLSGGGDLSSDRTISLDDNGVTLAKLADIATARIMGRSTAGTGDPEALTGTQVTALLDSFTSALKGLVPASGGSEAEMLSADGTFKKPLDVIDLRHAPYAVRAGDSSAATKAANTLAINAAVTAYSGTEATLLLPAGDIYLEQANPGSAASQRAWSIRFGPSVSKVALVGQGSGATRLIQEGDGNTGQWDCISIDGASRIALRGFSVEQGTIANPDAGDQMHLIGVYASQNVDCTDITISDVYFGACIGDALRVVGDGSGLGQEIVRRLRLVNFWMRTGGHALGAGGLGLGSRSGVSLQRGWRDVEIGNGYIHGAKNSPFEMEPTGTNICNGLVAHDLIIDNEGGQTSVALTIAGGSTSPIRRCLFSNILVLEGGVACANTFHTKLSNVVIYTAGAGPMSGASDTLLSIFNAHEDLMIENVDIVRDTGSSAGMLCQLVPLSSGYPRRVTFRGGAWRSEVGSGIETAYLYCYGASQTVIEGLRFRLNDIQANEAAIKFRPNAEDLNGCTVHDVEIATDGTKIAYGVYVTSTDSQATDDVSITNVRAPDAVTYGVMFDRTTGTTIDPCPILYGCDFTGATAAWSAQNNAVDEVFPIIMGNKGSTAVRWQLGTADPAGNVAAPQGSRYTRQNGDSSTEWFKGANADATGWERVGGDAATGSVTCVAKASLLDAETVTIGDGTRPAVVYEFDVAGDGVTAGNVQVDVSAATDAASVAAILKTAIEANQPLIAVTAAGSGVLNLAHGIAGTLGNVTITDTVANVGFLVSGMSGGVNPAR